MEPHKKILIAAIGLPKNGYNNVEWHFQNQTFDTPLPLIAIGAHYEVDHIILLGTDQALDPVSKHYTQLQEELQKFGLDKKLQRVPIGALNTRDEFWQAFHDVSNRPLFKQGPSTLYVDLTFGYRIQPMLIFLASYFLSETREHIRLKKVFYGMNLAKPPHILDMTELVYLLEWLKGTQLFVQGGSAKALTKMLKGISQEKFPQIVTTFEDFTDGYSFNYISYLNRKAKAFNKEYHQPKFVQYVKSHYPVIGLIHPYLKNFIDLFLDDDKIAMQLNAAKKNYEDGAYSRTVLILREAFITMMMEAFGFTRNKEREKVEKILINRVYWSLPAQKKDSMLSEREKEVAQKTYEILTHIFGKDTINQFFNYWGIIRELRNGSGHIKNVHKDKKIFFPELKNQLGIYLNEILSLFDNMRKHFAKAKDYRNPIENLLQNKIEFKLFVIVNEGVHPILPILQEQFGKEISVEVLTHGNVDLQAEGEIAQKCLRLAEKYRGYEIYLVPSGFPYLAVAAYNVLQQTLARHPIWLQYDRQSGKYLEKNLDPRKLITSEK